EESGYVGGAFYDLPPPEPLGPYLPPDDTTLHHGREDPPRHGNRDATRHARHGRHGRHGHCPPGVPLGHGAPVRRV
ncbi:uncharacterized protein CCOS01_12767, partial [Colletotrichum costaricense]